MFKGLKVGLELGLESLKGVVIGVGEFKGGCYWGWGV